MESKNFSKDAAIQNCAILFMGLILFGTISLAIVKKGIWDVYCN